MSENAPKTISVYWVTVKGSQSPGQGPPDPIPCNYMRDNWVVIEVNCH